jgi:hypothetical protein
LGEGGSKEEVQVELYQGEVKGKGQFFVEGWVPYGEKSTLSLSVYHVCYAWKVFLKNDQSELPSGPIPVEFVVKLTTSHPS